MYLCSKSTNVLDCINKEVDDRGSFPGPRPAETLYDHSVQFWAP